VPVHPEPLQPEKVLPEDAVAVRVTDVGDVYDAEQVLPQLIPEGLEVTVPFPDFVTVKVKVEGGVAEQITKTPVVSAQTVRVPVPTRLFTSRVPATVALPKTAKALFSGVEVFPEESVPATWKSEVAKGDIVLVYTPPIPCGLILVLIGAALLLAGFPYPAGGEVQLAARLTPAERIKPRIIILIVCNKSFFIKF